MRIVLAEKRAVREPEIGQLLVTERGSDHVHVFGRTHGVHKGKDLSAALFTSSCEVLVRLDACLFLLRIVEHGIERVERILLRSVEAPHRTALADSARIEADEVE